MAQTNVQAFSGDVEIASNVTAASSKFSLDTNGTLKQIGADLNNNYIKLMKYFGSASNWKIATGSYSGEVWQWLSIRAKMTRLNEDVEIIQFNYLGVGGASRVRDSIVIGGGNAYTQANEIKVYNRESNSTYEIYLQIDSATSVEVEITHRDSTIDDDYSTVATANDGAIDETGLTKIYDSGTTTDLRLKEGKVGVGTTNPGGKLDIQAGTSDPSGPTVHISDNVGDFGDYGMVNLVRHATDGGSKAHLAFIRNGVTIFGQGYYNNTNTFGFWPSFGSVANTPAMAFATNGSVGIGTTDPGTALEVRGTIRVQTGTNDATGGEFSIDTNVGHIRRKVGGNGVSLTSYDDFQFYVNATGGSAEGGTQAMIIDNSGNVGIGTVTPLHALDVKRDITIGSSTTTHLQTHFNIGNETLTGGDALMGYSGRNSNNIINAATYWKHTGGFYGTAGYFGIAVNHDSTGGEDPYGITDGELESRTHLVVRSNGNVGVGLTDPTYKLDILDHIRIRGNYPALYFSEGTSAATQPAFRIYNDGASQDDGNNYLAIQKHTTGGVYDSIIHAKLDGDVGIGKGDPSYKLDVAGIIRATDRIHADVGVDLPAGYGYCALLPGTGDGASYAIHNSIYRTWWSIGVRDYANNCRILLDARTGDILGTGTVGSTSDDRLKINEKRITRATDTISKLDPQLYHKMNKSSILPNEGEGVMYQTESGLIAQDIWYDAPELRHLVKLGIGADPAIEKPYRNPDITIDPDYSGWGPEPATVNYIGLIPYLIKSVQEIATELPNVKTGVSNVNVSNVDNYHGLIVSANKPDVYISTSSYDTKCYGVVSEENVETINNEILINTSRDGKVWVIDVENLQSGDYITTSNVAGYGMKQSDDLVHNYTVAKILQDCDFIPTQVPVKRVVRETRDVTYYVKREYSDLPKDGSEAHIHDNKIVEIDEVYYTKSTLVSVPAHEDYTSRTFTPEITEEAYDALDESDRESYTVEYFKTEITDIRIEEYESLSTSKKEEYEQMTRRVRKILKLIETKEPLPGYEIETRTEEVDVLDSNGQLVWEQTSETRVSYTIKNIDATGAETDEANAVHKAALVNCKVVL